MSGLERRFATLVTGLPRSGTSLVMQMLRAGGLPPLCDGVRRPDAHNPRGYLEYAPLRRLGRDVGWPAGAQGRALKLVHPLLRALPAGEEVRVVWVRRRLEAVAASQAAMLASGGAEALAAGAAEPLLRSALADLEAWLGARVPGHWLRLDYEALLRDPATAAEGLEVFLGGGLDRAAMVRAVDPALRHY